MKIINAFEKSRNCKDKPTCIIAKTFKGKYIPEWEDQLDCHGKPLSGEKSK